MNEQLRRSPVDLSSRLLLGGVLTALGVIFTARNMGWFRVDLHLVFPVAMITIGLLVAPRFRVWRSFGSLFLVGFGTLWILREYDILRVSVWRLWPLILVAFGLNIVFAGLRRVQAASDADDSTVFNAWAVFGGVGRKLGTRDFRGGDAGAFCGGWDIDLREAGMTVDQAEISVFAWWGGGEIRVPKDWDVTVKVSPILGGVEDKTTHPVPGSDGPPPKRLVVSGLLVMGGVEIKN